MEIETIKLFIAARSEVLSGQCRYSAQKAYLSLSHSLERFIKSLEGVTKREKVTNVSNRLEKTGDRLTEPSTAYKPDDLTFSQLDADFLHRYEHHLMDSGCLRNSSSAYLRTFRSICRQAEKRQLLEDSQSLFTGLFMGYEKTDRRALTLKQLRQVADADLNDCPRLAKTRDWFVLSYYLRGIPFIDLAYLRKSDVRGGVLYYRRSKTKRPLAITLETWMTEIIKRYPGENSGTVVNPDPSSSTGLSLNSASPYLLNIISHPGSIGKERQQYESALRLYNKRLQQLSKRLKLGVKLTSYVARHTWATLAYNEEIPVSKISEGLSHASEEVTYVYLRSFTPDQMAEVNLQMAALINEKANRQWTNGKENFGKQRRFKRHENTDKQWIKHSPSPCKKKKENVPFLCRKRNKFVDKRRLSK